MLSTLRRGKELEKVKLIVNEDSFTGIDIHDQRDLKLASCNELFNKNNLTKDMIIWLVEQRHIYCNVAYNRPSHLRRLLISLENYIIKKAYVFLDGLKMNMKNYPK